MTGAGGFVGARLVERLLTIGARPVLVVRPGSDRWRLSGLTDDAEVIEVELRDPEAVTHAVKRARADWIFHLAAHGAYSWQDDARIIIDTNLMGMLNLLEASAGRGFEAFVHAGSSSEYGFKDHAPSEEEAAAPNSYYAVGKAAATMLGQHVAQQGGLQVTTLRLSSVYGPWEEPRRLVPRLIAHGVAGTLPPLVAPDTARDFVFVDDVCEAFVAVATARGEHSPIFNVGSGIQTTVREIVEVARAELGIDVVPRWGDYEARAWDARVWVSDPSRIARELDWCAAHDLTGGFSATVRWLHDRPDLWERYGVADARAADW